MYFFYADVGLLNTYPGLSSPIRRSASPFVVITVTATLIGFDQTLIRAAASLGAPPITIFFKVMLPLILPGVISGALFAFVTSFDEVVVVLFVASPEQRTLPKADVHRHPRDDQPHHHRRRDGADPRLHRHADHGRAPAPALGAAAGHQGLEPDRLKPKRIEA